MSGKPKVKCYEYTPKGMYIRSWDSVNDLKRFHYPEDIGSRPIFTKQIEGYDFHVTPSDTVIMKERVYRQGIKKLYKIFKSPLCNFNISKHSKKTIEMFNLKGEKLGEFSSIAAAKAILDKRFATSISNQVSGRTREGTDNLNNDFYFKFK